MKKLLLITILLFVSTTSYSQISGSFTVQGDIDKFYPVRFLDGGWINNVPTTLTLGRSDVHKNSLWRGSLMATFNYHVSIWGNGSSFINADIKAPLTAANVLFLGGWQDVTTSNSDQYIIIWLRGGGTTYYHQSNYEVNPTVYDGVQNILPYNVPNGGSLTFKTTVDEYSTATGTYQSRNAYFAANVGIATTAPDEKLTVKGKIHTQEVRVDMAGPLVPDYVFAEDYKLKSLQEVEDFIKENKHLPEIPSAQEIEKNGLMLAEMNMSLLKKIEEITLYMIEMKKENEIQNQKIQSLESKLKNKTNE
jgi:hypothetical protein